ncbi:uncharacterized protein LOC115318439 [Ixodes scapularis]|uniref:uncharacterized protein LOC115318439 n=1 Tax=Ixodes scapularis TaxID=6945 RepID=UPI001C380B20|nr:uncharacterized protein LOC115318439 [Ixodes scapularis]
MLDATERDPVMLQLRDYASTSWPDSKDDVPDELKLYWNYRDEIHVEDGLPQLSGFIDNYISLLQMKAYTSLGAQNYFTSGWLKGLITMQLPSKRIVVLSERLNAEVVPPSHPVVPPAPTEEELKIFHSRLSDAGAVAALFMIHPQYSDKVLAELVISEEMVANVEKISNQLCHRIIRWLHTDPCKYDQHPAKRDLYSEAARHLVFKYRQLGDPPGCGIATASRPPKDEGGAHRRVSDRRKVCKRSSPCNRTDRELCNRSLSGVHCRRFVKMENAKEPRKALTPEKVCSIRAAFSTFVGDAPNKKRRIDLMNKYVATFLQDKANQWRKLEVKSALQLAAEQPPAQQPATQQLATQQPAESG